MIFYGTIFLANRFRYQLACDDGRNYSLLAGTRTLNFAPFNDGGKTRVIVHGEYDETIGTLRVESIQKA